MQSQIKKILYKNIIYLLLMEACRDLLVCENLEANCTKRICNNTSAEKHIISICELHLLTGK